MKISELRDLAKAKIAEYRAVYLLERDLLKQEKERFDRPIYSEGSDPFRKDEYQGDQFDGELEVWYCKKCGVRAVRHPGQPVPDASAELTDINICPNAEDHVWVPANAWLTDRGRQGVINKRQFFRKK